MKKDLPEVTMDSLQTYQEYLEKSLRFPFEAISDEEIGFMHYNKTKFVAKKLVQFNRIIEDGFYGLFCQSKTNKGK